LRRGGNLGGLGRRPPKFEVGDGPCIRPPIFREVVLSDVRESMERVKKWCFSCEERAMHDILESKDPENQ